MDPATIFGWLTTGILILGIALWVFNDLASLFVKVVEALQDDKKIDAEEWKDIKSELNTVTRSLLNLIGIDIDQLEKIVLAYINSKTSVTPSDV